jgi:hypothetical protein
MSISFKFEKHCDEINLIAFHFDRVINSTNIEVLFILTDDLNIQEGKLIERDNFTYEKHRLLPNEVLEFSSIPFKIIIMNGDMVGDQLLASPMSSVTIVKKGLEVCLRIAFNNLDENNELKTVTLCKIGDKYKVVKYPRGLISITVTKRGFDYLFNSTNLFFKEGIL